MGHNQKTKSREQRVTDNRGMIRELARTLRKHDLRIEKAADDAMVARLRLEARMVRDIEELAIQLALLRRPWREKLREWIRDLWRSSAARELDVQELEKEAEKLSIPISQKRELELDDQDDEAALSVFGNVKAEHVEKLKKAISDQELAVELDDQDEEPRLLMIGADGEETEIDPKPESGGYLVYDDQLHELEKHFEPAPELREKGKAV